jgi:hypothetical protein
MRRKKTRQAGLVCGLGAKVLANCVAPQKKKNLPTQI